MLDSTTKKTQSQFLRPREKIRELGVQRLTTQELLSVILGSGMKNIPVEILAKRITQKLQLEKSLALNDLQKIKGIGLAKASQILAAIELVERLRPSNQPEFPILDSLKKVLNQLAELRYAQREQLLCLYLNARMQLVFKETLAMGSASRVLIGPSDIFAVIKQKPISFLVLAHNHPTGVLLPSQEDISFTHRIAQAGQLLGVELLDHIIIGKEEHYSLHEQVGLFPK